MKDVRKTNKSGVKGRESHGNKLLSIHRSRGEVEGQQIVTARKSTNYHPIIIDDFVVTKHFFSCQHSKLPI